MTTQKRRHTLSKRIISYTDIAVVSPSWLMLNKPRRSALGF